MVFSTLENLFDVIFEFWGELRNALFFLKVMSKQKIKEKSKLFIIDCVYLGHFGIPASVDGTAKDEFCILQKETVTRGYILNQNTFGNKFHFI